MATSILGAPAPDFSRRIVLPESAAVRGPFTTEQWQRSALVREILDMPAPRRPEPLRLEDAAACSEHVELSGNEIRRTVRVGDSIRTERTVATFAADVALEIAPDPVPFAADPSLATLAARRLEIERAKPRVQSRAVPARRAALWPYALGIALAALTAWGAWSLSRVLL